MRFLRQNGKPEVDFLKEEAYADFRSTLDAKMKRLKRAGVGSHKQQAEPLTQEEEELLWEKHILGDHSPKALLNSVFFFIGVCFALRSGDEHGRCASRSAKFMWWRSQESEPISCTQRTPPRTIKEDSKAASSRRRKSFTMKTPPLLLGAQYAYSGSTTAYALKIARKMLFTTSH